MSRRHEDLDHFQLILRVSCCVEDYEHPEVMKDDNYTQFATQNTIHCTRYNVREWATIDRITIMWVHLNEDIILKTKKFWNYPTHPHVYKWNTVALEEEDVQHDSYDWFVWNVGRTVIRQIAATLLDNVLIKDSTDTARSASRMKSTLQRNTFTYVRGCHVRCHFQEVILIMTFSLNARSFIMFFCFSITLSCSVCEESVIYDGHWSNCQSVTCMT